MADMSESTSIDKSGRLIVPAAIRRQLGIRPGDRLHLRIENGELRISTWQKAVDRVQEMLAGYRSGADEELASETLIRERREEGSAGQS
jgi:AbrB family looped-hinge helix DNA binding protein